MLKDAYADVVDSIGYPKFNEGAWIYKWRWVIFAHCDNELGIGVIESSGNDYKGTDGIYDDKEEALGFGEARLQELIAKYGGNVKGDDNVRNG